MPRSCTGRSYWLHRFTPQTCSCPLTSTGVPSSGAGGGSSTEPVQATPLSVNAVGRGLAPVKEPVNPRSTVAPVASVRFQSTAAAVTVAPDCDQVAFQPWTLFCPASGMVNPSVHPETGAPRLVILT